MEHYLKPARTAGGTLPRGTFPGPRRALEEIGGTLVEPSSGARRAGGTWWKPGGNLVETWWNPRGTLPQTTSDHPAALAEHCETLAEFWWKSGGTLVKPSSNQTTPALEEIAGTLVEPSWNLTSNHPGPPCSPGGTLVEPYLEPPRPPRSLEPWWNPGGTLVNLPQTRSPRRNLWNPGGTLTSNHPRPPRPCRTWWNPGGTLVEPWWNPGGTLVEPWWNPALVEPWWNLSSGSPRTTPEPIWAETPKLSAVGGKRRCGRPDFPKPDATQNGIWGALVWFIPSE